MNEKKNLQEHVFQFQETLRPLWLEWFLGDGKGRKENKKDFK